MFSSFMTAIEENDALIAWKYWVLCAHLVINSFFSENICGDGTAAVNSDAFRWQMSYQVITIIG